MGKAKVGYIVFIVIIIQYIFTQIFYSLINDWNLLEEDEIYLLEKGYLKTEEDVLQHYVESANQLERFKNKNEIHFNERKEINQRLLSYSSPLNMKSSQSSSSSSFSHNTSHFNKNRTQYVPQYFPILVVTSNRTTYLRRCLLSLRHVRGINWDKVYVFEVQ